VISRRQLIGSGIAVSAIGIGARIASAIWPATPHVAPRFLLVDTRFDDALEIARLTAPPGIETIRLQRDVLELWHHRLKPMTGAVPFAFAGVTTEHGFFTLRTLAADHRLRVRSAKWHAPRVGHGAREPLVSWVIGQR
jgi:hypothetical protein